MKAFLSSLSRSKRYVVAELFLVYFAQGLSSIMLGSVLPDLRAAYALDYQIGGTLLSAQSIGYLGIGLLSGLAAIKWGLKRAYLILYYVFAVGFVMLLTNGSPVWLLAAMFLTGISKGAITDYNNRVMSEYANGSATPLNMMHAAYAFGACVAPLAVLACHKLGGDNGWRLALEISIVLLTASFIFGLFMKMDDDKSTKTEQKSATDYGFFREKLFWLCTALCFFYEAVEASMMGWLTSFYIDSGVLAADAAQIITSLLWVSLLIGRFSCSVIAAKFRPWQMITVSASAWRRSSCCSSPEPRCRFSPLRRLVWGCACPACTAQRWPMPEICSRAIRHPWAFMLRLTASARLWLRLRSASLPTARVSAGVLLPC